MIAEVDPVTPAPVSRADPILPGVDLRLQDVGSRNHRGITRSPPGARTVILIVVLIVVLATPTIVWVALHRKPRRPARPKVTTSGVKHRWWQP
ncbi:MAG TPA: hypothetical protein VHU85_17270 [Acidimicrobiales bacterium]|jgi:hypothetical protein|nr:hypothetical protein [Acidimicrobiales bacterium]